MQTKVSNSRCGDRPLRLSTMVLPVVFAGLVIFVLPQNVMAQQTTRLAKQTTKAVQQTTASTTDEEEQMDTALRKFGYVAGQAHQCQTDAAQKTKFEKTALDIANGVLRLFGSDRAFLFATAYGAGLTDKIEQKDCAEAVKKYETAIGKLKVLASK